MLANPHRRRATALTLAAMTAAAATRAVSGALAASKAATAAATAAASAAPPFPPPPLGEAGPCGAAPPLRGTFTALTGDRVNAILTLPAASAPGREAPWPVVWLGSGFQTRASAYTRIASHLASYGYATLQYDPTRLLTLTPDVWELGWLADALAWARGAAPPATLHPTTLAVAGHSRGGKLAALHYAGVVAPPPPEGAPPPPPPLPARPAACFLFDAVDSTSFAPPSPAYPSAADALPGSGPVGFASAAVIGPCNPAASGYRRLWKSVDGGSTQLLLDSGHAQFFDSGRLWNLLADGLCGRGRAGREATLRAASAAAVAWFDSRLRPNSSSSSTDAFVAWAEVAAAAPRAAGSPVEAWAVKLRSASEAVKAGGGDASAAAPAVAAATAES